MADNQLSEALLAGNGPVPSDLLGDEAAYQHLLQAARQLIDRIHQREEEVHRLLRVTENINRGLGLEEVLEFLYEEFRSLIPFNRIGCALIDEVTGQVVSRWARSDRPILLGKDFRAPLAGSTLADVVRTGRPRILNDLEEYLRQKPRSASTELIVREGMRSSLTCPLVVRGRPVGFLFFDSDQPGTYSRAHVEFFQQAAGQLSLILEKGRLYSELAEQAALIERQNRQLLAELELARHFQRSMIPAEGLRVPGLEIAFAYRPALQVGGDILDVLPLADRRAVVFVGDAAGHGVQAAMVMAAVKTALLRAVHATSEPTDLLRQVNDELYEMLLGERFVTAVCARLDAEAGRADLALAGHVNPLHIRAASGEVNRLGDTGLPLGVNSGVDYQLFSCPLAPGDTLVFLTDGVLEAENPLGEFYGETRFVELVRRHGSAAPNELVQTIDADVRSHCQGRDQGDDQTVLVVRCVTASLRKDER
jgi:serine phosphatase RsbU (regulator of sigma subunit)